MKKIIINILMLCVFTTTYIQPAQNKNRSHKMDNAEYFQDADSITCEPNGTLTVRYPDRKIVTYFPYGVVRTLLPDGTQIFQPQPINRTIMLAFMNYR